MGRADGSTVGTGEGPFELCPLAFLSTHKHTVHSQMSLGSGAIIDSTY